MLKGSTKIPGGSIIVSCLASDRQSAPSNKLRQNGGPTMRDGERTYS